ncbi:nonribosomal peptide synthetase 2 [Pyrenophora tritici-repentis Pt-1C-BFP]|uniref:Nonribosomal peptide synthetase 2 n=1 Tax=Pyrenophora tritici-repentis (strain Pt-1C-BFP) TaxID=426418 RepID=B2WFB6_PYRTR|nr:nonribosomal peptide synthetase 2 [Pyrenophora tritici-repentis Pt-1C-BFP]EDU51196.1 nonribosomal peptide synthetase 2 [Pyrenophora tritici-repentis Pt-1C-BFP]
MPPLSWRHLMPLWYPSSNIVKLPPWTSSRYPLIFEQNQMLALRR